MFCSVSKKNNFLYNNIYLAKKCERTSSWEKSLGNIPNTYMTCIMSIKKPKYNIGQRHILCYR